MRDIINKIRAYINKGENDKKQEQDISLTVAHIPFHGNFGSLDEIKTPELEIKNYSIDNNTILDLGKIKMQVTKINADSVEVRFFDNKGVVPQSSRTKDKEWTANLNYLETYKLYLEVMDAMETWSLEFKDLKSNKIKLELKMELSYEEEMMFEGKEIGRVWKTRPEPVGYIVIDDYNEIPKTYLFNGVEYTTELVSNGEEKYILIK